MGSETGSGKSNNSSISSILSLISLSFVSLYSIGVIVLVYDGFSSGFNNLVIANLASLIASLAVLVKLKFF